MKYEIQFDFFEITEIFTFYKYFIIDSSYDEPLLQSCSK